MGRTPFEDLCGPCVLTLCAAAIFGVSRAEAAETAPAMAADGERPEEVELFPQGELFEPLIADVHWPRFTAEYQWRLGSDEFDQVGAVGFGETFAFVRSPEHDWGQWEVGIQASVDATFDMGEKSFDLVNGDYFVGLTATLLHAGIATQLRVYHVSAHLGDEYLIENGGRRSSVSFEVIDILASYDALDWLRVYGGLGAVVSSHTSTDPVLTEFGLEATSPTSYWSGRLTPIAGLDVQVRQQNDWVPDIALLTGLRLADPDDDVRRIEFFARYYNGRSPDGQFFRNQVQSIGLGFRLGF